MGNIITNEGVKNLGLRLKELIEYSKQIDILVGFFYFSGLNELYEALRTNKELKIRVLVGLGADDLVVKLVNDKREDFIEILKKVVKTEEFDNEEAYKKYEFYLELIKEGRLILRKTIEPNHAKLYIFHTKEEYQNLLKGAFITGSSNFTKSGLKLQKEFNVEIRDWGFDFAKEYFERLWQTAERITEDSFKREKLIKVIKNSPLGVIEPFLAYAYTLKNYIDTLKSYKTPRELKYLFESKGYKPFAYQLDAVVQAVETIKSLGGIILADVVGLGKSVIASAIAHLLGKRGIVIAPPHLVGDKTQGTGWYKYLRDFELLSLGWEVFSLGKLEDVFEFVRKENDIEVVIVDEAHRFRNENTKNYELLNLICRGKKVILLTATPFNNKPSDIFALLKLILPPKNSPLVVDKNLKDRFVYYENQFEKLSYILKYCNSSSKEKRKKAVKLYKELFGEKSIDTSKVKRRIKDLARRIRSVISPVVIRRNRLDLVKHPIYSKEITDLPKVKDPKEVFYELTEEQLKFYDKVLKVFLPPEEGGKFSGAIYMPILYEKSKSEIKNLEDKENFDYWIQRNLYDFMRRLLVRRLESSFGAFKDSIESFIKIHKTVLDFIKETNLYFLDRSLIEKVINGDLELEEALKLYAEKVKKRELDKRFHRVYEIEKFKRKKQFLKDIERDIKLLEEIKEDMKKVGLTDRDKDPKAQELVKLLKKLLEDRKVVIFTEFVSTANHLREILEKHFPGKVLYAYGNISKSVMEQIYENFDASYGKQKNDYSILLATDKLSEGFNLNRAGAVINYDIPWNPVRVIQRVGRVNRIGKKVYDEIYIFNFFPTEKGADITKAREIASQKLFMIHNILGEDSKILEPDEEPSPSKLFEAVNRNPDLLEEESLETKVFNEWERIQKENPEILKELEELSNRVKTAKRGKENKILTFVRRKNIFFCVEKKPNTFPEEKPFEEVLSEIKTDRGEKSLKLSENFWRDYQHIQNYIKGKLVKVAKVSRTDIESLALNNLQSLLKKTKNQEVRDFIKQLLEEIKNFGTLPERTLRTLARLREEDFEEELLKLKKILPLSGTKEQPKDESEIIVSFELQKEKQN